MGTLTGLFNITRHALLADQTAINATAANISNENSAGYSKRTVTFSENDTVQIAGTGVATGTTATVTAQRDRVLDQAVQQATDTASSSSTRLAALKQIESIFSLDSSGNDSSGIEAGISQFFNGISALAADPTSASARSSALSAATAVVAAFNGAASQVSTQTGILNQQVVSGVTQVNSLLQQIATANGQISSSLPNEDVNSIVDLRTQLITQLSGLIGLQQTTTENGSITLSASNGTLLVGGTNVFQLATTSVSGTTRVLAASNLGGADITSTLQGGSIGGSIQARDVDLPAVAAQLDTLAYNFATSVNTQNKAGLDANGNAGGAIFAIGTSSAGAAASIGVALTSGASLAAASTTEGASGNGNANALLALQTASTVNGQTYSGAYNALLTGVGNTVASATTDSTADTAIQTQLTTQRDNTSGVSLDEEASNLTQYQRSYQAAAKLLSILNTLLGAAINIGTETAVS